MPYNVRNRLVVALVLAMVAVPICPQSGSGPQVAGDDTLVLKIKTRLVVVDVVIHDRKGKVVPDLSADDFKIAEDGKEQKISIFNFQHPGVGDALPVQRTKLPPGVFGNAPSYQANRALNVVLVDALNTTFLNQAYVRVEMVKFLQQLPQGQPIAIYTMGRKLRLLQDFTTDLTQLKKVIHTMKGESSHVLSDPNGTSEVPMTLQGIADQITAELAPQFRAPIPR